MPFRCSGCVTLSLKDRSDCSKDDQAKLCFKLDQPSNNLLVKSNCKLFSSVSLSHGIASHGLEPSLQPGRQLPFGIKQGSKILQYVWDGQAVAALDEHTLAGGGDNPVGALRRTLSKWQDQLYKAFIPSTKDVTTDYWDSPSACMQRFFSSTMQNLSTQSMLLALGLGAKKTIAASAVINWLLKDGVGRIARMTVATNLCQSFDSELKRIRFTTSVIFEATIGCEFLTPLFPQHFLALASIANAGKAIALSAFVSTAPAFQRALCSGGNLADLTAKNQAQHMVIDMLALGVSAAAMYTVRNSERWRILLPLVCFPVLAAADLYSIYMELKAVELKLLNRERSEMLAERWLRTGRAFTASEVTAV
ncbi:hypothetical protein CEUSTIGMA_g8279.t1 [Chlamydomonas eustigma]|uniref:Protein root UVB sensitive/RUS domain-containing protein n=1 Tax=Chlamydomonas eustigma TaxID=1157962 RepID=A0A250XCR1_9CHLO|nr:hypothetical protein CEUSTIGMA_g8279.t1 [Chlamydomonas eustigma]|eukprot:GAX80844.1 hypothetical protein CEUSTIGMA_g8279.t1 [Chlamydomonas eustigma]